MYIISYCKMELSYHNNNVNTDDCANDADDYSDDDDDRILCEHADVLNEIENSFNTALTYYNNRDSTDDDNDDYTTTTTTICAVSWIDMMNETELEELECTAIELLNDYMETEIENMYMATFEENMCNDVAYVLSKQLCDAGFSVEDDDPELEEFIKQVYQEIRSTNSALIVRSRPTTSPEYCNEYYKQTIDSILECLQNNEGQQYKQRTFEWYAYRAGLITASNIWKIFSGSQSSQNSLIYEKCKPFVPHQKKNTEDKENENEKEHETDNHVNTNTAFHWGNKYEPLSIRIYERKYNTRVAEFGCLRHPKYSFIGASPDGINVCRDSPRYGRMIEVKNIYNREITGIPKDEYWIQMQFQMETCCLNECDFIETRFKEYESEAEFYANEFTHETRGVILYFVERNVNTNQSHIKNINPYYVYMPLDHSLERECVYSWITQMREEYKNTHHLYEVLYWYLDEFSCVLVDINRLWLDSVLPKVEAFWEIICREKETGYEHRSAKKRVPKEENMSLNGRNSISNGRNSISNGRNSISNGRNSISNGRNSISNVGFCLIKLDADGNPI